jgi:hypothetical protein
MARSGLHGRGAIRSKRGTVKKPGVIRGLLGVVGGLLLGILGLLRGIVSGLLSLLRRLV